MPVQDQDRIAALWSATFPFEALRATRSSANNVEVVKEAMIQRGWLTNGHVRPPLSPLPEADRAAVTTTLERLNPCTENTPPR